MNFSFSFLLTFRINKVILH